MLMVVMLLILAGCSDPKDIVFGPEPLKQIAEQGDKFKNLPEEERKLLAAYLSLNEMGNLFGNKSNSVVGMTAGEVIVKAKEWQNQVQAAEAEQKKRDDEAKALQEKSIAERKVIADKILSSVVVAVIDKTILSKDYDIGRYQDLLKITYAVENKTAKAIRQLKGTIIFNDAVGDKIGSLPISFEEKIEAGKTLNTTTGSYWKINSISNGEIEKIAGTEFNLMKTSFEPEAIAFDDGEVIKAPELIKSSGL